jgi:hypothetical protein
MSSECECRRYNVSFRKVHGGILAHSYKNAVGYGFSDAADRYVVKVPKGSPMQDLELLLGRFL